MMTRSTPNPSRVDPQTTPPAGILFTAFEPSGDAHAAPVIAELKKQEPDRPIYAWGGPLMESAGAEIIESTCTDGTMGLGSLGKIAEHWHINKRIKRWLSQQRIAIHIPVDSPAANFPICKLTRRAGCRIVHLVAPQIWAWGPWRINKLRRLTDLVLCLLPFEKEFFTSRNVPATFIGHPILTDREAETDKPLGGSGNALPQGSPKLVFLPGSRTSEIKRHSRDMVRLFSEIQLQKHGACGAIAAANAQLADPLHQLAPNLPTNLFVLSGRLDEVLDWADLVITCSGTATLDVAYHHRPMVVIYKVNPIPWYLLGRWLITIPNIALPNLIMGREIVPEFAPYFIWNRQQITHTVAHLLQDSKRLIEQSDDLKKLTSLYEGDNSAELAVKEIRDLLDSK